MSKDFPMTPHRARILEVLAAGDINDSDGQAVSLLMQDTGHKTTNALSGVLASMEAAGVIERQTAGRRTYFIGLTPAGRRLAKQWAAAPGEAQVAQAEPVRGKPEAIQLLHAAAARVAELEAALDDAQAKIKQLEAAPVDPVEASELAAAEAALRRVLTKR